MIEINLLPEEMRKKESGFKKVDLSALNLQRVPILPVTIAAAVILLAVHIILFSAGNYCKKNFNEMSKKYKEISPQKKESDILTVKVAAINQKVSAIDELMVKRFSWAKKLNDLSDCLTPGIWLNGLYYEQKVGERTIAAKLPGPSAGKGKKTPPMQPQTTERVMVRYLILSGYASSMGEQGAALVGKFIKSLKDNPGFYSDFSNIELGSIRSDKIENQEVMSFKITCSFKESGYDLKAKI